MRSSSKLAGFGVAVGATTAVAALLLGSSAATADQPARPERAYALATNGLVTLGPLVSVASPTGTRVYDELVGLRSVPGTQALGLEAGLLTAEAKAGYATSSVAHVKLAGLLTADLVKTTCEQGGGALEIVGGQVLGHTLPHTPISGQKIDLSPIATVTLGAQSPGPNGSTTVTGIVVTLLPVSPAQHNDPVTPTVRAALPALGDALGVDLVGATTLGDVVDTVSGAVGTVTKGATQTVTVGSATCAPTAAPRPDEPVRPVDQPAAEQAAPQPQQAVVEDEPAPDTVDEPAPDTDDTADDSADDTDHGDHDVEDVPDAPVPADVPQASLPVTG